MDAAGWKLLVSCGPGDRLTNRHRHLVQGQAGTEVGSLLTDPVPVGEAGAWGILAGGG